MSAAALANTAPAAVLPVGLEALASLLLVVGGLFALLGAIGLVRLRSFPARLHAPTKASTLGLGGALLASMICFGVWESRAPIQELLITVWVFFTAPVSAHLLMQAHLALHRDATVANAEAPPSAERPSDRPGSDDSPG